MITLDNHKQFRTCACNNEERPMEIVRLLLEDQRILQVSKNGAYRHDDQQTNKKRNEWKDQKTKDTWME